MPTKDEIIAFLATYGIQNDSGVYRLIPACEEFWFTNPNTDSDCCEEDLMLPRKDMVIRLWSIINGFGTFNKDNWEKCGGDYTPLVFLDGDEEGGDHKCICTHNLFRFNFIKHIPTNIVLLVGCECIDKIDKRIRYKHKNCKICKADFPENANRARKPYSSGYCSDKCKVLGDEKKKLEKELAKKLERERMMLEYEKEREKEMAIAREIRKEKYLKENKQSNPIQHKKLLLKDKTIENETMNIHSNDNQYLSQSDAKKLENYERVDFGNLNVGDHFRYTTNKYQQQGRKLAYGVVKTKELNPKGSEALGSITVNGYSPNPEEEPMYPDWTIKHPDRNKQYNFYKKIKLYSQNVSDNISDDEIE